MSEMYTPGEVVIVKSRRVVVREKYLNKDLELKRQVVTSEGKFQPADVMKSPIQYEKHQVVLLAKKTPVLICERYDKVSNRLSVRDETGKTSMVDAREISDYPMPWFRKGQHAVVVVGGAIPKGTQVTVQTDGGAPGKIGSITVKHSGSNESFVVSSGHLIPR